MLVWQNSYMKERFWFVYYWLMVGYLGLALLTIVEYQNKYELTEITHLITGKTCSEHNNTISRTNELRKKDGDSGVILSFWACTPGEQRKKYLPVSDVFKFSNEILFFNYIEDLRYSRTVDNYYPFILVFLMTLIRFIFIGKHIWERPKHGA